MADHQPIRDSDHEQDVADQPVHHATFDPETDTVGEAVVEAVATVKDADPTAIARLTDAVDPDALDELFGPREDGTPRNTDGYIVFNYDEYTVHIHSEGTIAIYAPDE